jgi:hypothetical protein
MFLKLCVSLAAFSLIGYVVGSFISWNLNPGQWDLFARMIIGVVVLFLSAAVTIEQP